MYIAISKDLNSSNCFLGYDGYNITEPDYPLWVVVWVLDVLAKGQRSWIQSYSKSLPSFFVWSEDSGCGTLRPVDGIFRDPGKSSFKALARAALSSAISSIITPSCGRLATLIRMRIDPFEKRTAAHDGGS